MQQLRQGGRRPWAGFTRIDAHADGATTPGSVLTVHLSRHDPVSEPVPGGTLLTRFLTAVDAGPYGDARSTASFQLGSQTSPAVAAWVRDHEAPELVVDRLMSQLVVANAVGAVVDDHACRVGLRPEVQLPDASRDGVLLTMRCEEPGAPVELFPALLYCWLSWWRKQVGQSRIRPEAPPLRRGNLDDYAEQLAERIHTAAELHRRQPVPRAEIPRPPERLDLIEDGRRYAVRLDDVEPTFWPDLPPTRSPID